MKYFFVPLALLVAMSVLNISILKNIFYFNSDQNSNKFTDIKKKNFETQLKHCSKKKITSSNFKLESTPIIADIQRKNLVKIKRSVSFNGADKINSQWEKHEGRYWSIELQRTGHDFIVAGIQTNNQDFIETGFKMLDWGFKHQYSDGSFRGSIDTFHSTSFFVEAVAHALLMIQQSSYSCRYAHKVDQYLPLLHEAARWMIDSKVWDRGIVGNKPYTHRRYLVAAALGETGKLTGDMDLIRYAHKSLEDGLSLQSPDGSNPEKNGYDSSYQAVGIIFAQRWVTNFPNDPITPQVKNMINRALIWEETRILRTGEISTIGNTRTAGQERNRYGKVKKVGPDVQIRAFAYWGAAMNNVRWKNLSLRIYNYYYGSI
jgi:hypothetical protein